VKTNKRSWLTNPNKLTQSLKLSKKSNIKSQWLLTRQKNLR